MNIKKLLTEETADRDFALKLHYDCAQFFKQNGYGYKSLPLYRGLNKSIQTYRIIEPRKNRIPKNTKLQLHNALDKLLYKKFGWKPRSEGVFCTGSEFKARFYGYVYIMLPIGDFKFVWSPKIDDLFNQLSLNGITDFNTDEIIKKDYLPDLKKIADTYTDKDLVSAILSGNEISIKCNKYYLINTDYIKPVYNIIFQ